MRGGTVGAPRITVGRSHCRPPGVTSRGHDLVEGRAIGWMCDCVSRDMWVHERSGTVIRLIFDSDGGMLLSDPHPPLAWPGRGQGGGAACGCHQHSWLADPSSDGGPVLPGMVVVDWMVPANGRPLTWFMKSTVVR